MQVILNTAELIKCRIRDNIRSKASPEGLLLQKEEKYLQCLATQHQELEILYKKDETDWL